MKDRSGEQTTVEPGMIRLFTVPFTHYSLHLLSFTRLVSLSWGTKGKGYRRLWVG